MTSKTRRRITHCRVHRRKRGSGTISGYNAINDPIHMLGYLARQTGGYNPFSPRMRGGRRRKVGRGRGSWARIAFKRDEYGRLLKKDIRHV